MYNLICLMGEAGSGKDFLLGKLLEGNPELHKLTYTTSRPKRDYEVNNIDYHFVSKEEFCEDIKNKKMLFYNSFNDWLYGIPKEELREDKVNIGIFNPRTFIDQPHFADDCNIMIYRLRAPAKERLLRQLNREEEPDCDEIVRRFQSDNTDFRNLHINYMWLDNNSLEDAAAAIVEVKGLL